MGTQLVWFKRDLRVHDHEPLLRASQAGPCIFLYVYETEILESREYDLQHLRFVNQCLEELADNLKRRGARLTLRRGRMPDVLDELHNEVPFESIWSHEETGNRVTYDRDLRVAQWAKRTGVEWHELTQTGVIRRLGDRDGWSRRWHRTMEREIVPMPGALDQARLRNHGRRLGERSSRLGSTEKTETQAGGEQNARKLLDSFLACRGEGYTGGMSSPVTAYDACSRLSPHFAHGTISIREVFQRSSRRTDELKALRRSGTDIGAEWLTSLSSFRSRLRWHCHFMQKLEDEPEIEFRNLSRAYDSLRPEAFDDNAARCFEAWQHGRTGYPMIDACMRSLRTTGWINFRMRAMLVSFAAYHLWLHWREPGLFLARQFLDFEPGIHWSQMQMQSGTTGINANRIYSPIKQVTDQDPGGFFLRRWLPELEGVPDKRLPEPWKMSRSEQDAARCVLGKDYPLPIVDHQQAYSQARSRMRSIKSSEQARRDARAIQAKHGSRSRRRPG